MTYRIIGTPGYSSEGVVFPPMATEQAAWDRAIDIWKGVPTARRPEFREQAFMAMQRNGYKVEAVLAQKGDTATVHTDRPELGETYVGKTGRVIAVQTGTGDVLLKFKGKTWPVSFPRTHVTVGASQ